MKNTIKEVYDTTTRVVFGLGLLVAGTALISNTIYQLLAQYVHVVLGTATIFVGLWILAYRKTQ